MLSTHGIVPWRRVLAIALVMFLASSTGVPAQETGGAVSSASAPAAQADPILDIDPGGHRGSVWSIAFSPDGRYLLSGGDDKAVRVWDVAAAKTIRFLRGEVGRKSDGKIYAIAASPDGQTAAVAGQFGKAPPVGSIRLVDIATGVQKGRLEGHKGAVYNLAFSQSGTLLASVGTEGNVRVWNVAERRMVRDFALGKSASALRVVFLDETHVASSGVDGMLRIFDLSGGQQLEPFAASGVLSGLAASESGDLVAVGGDDGVVRVWSRASGSREPLSVFRANANVSALAFGRGPGASLLATGSGEDPFEVTIWDARTKARIGSHLHDNFVRAVTFSPDGRTIASAGGNRNQIDLWAVDDPLKVKSALAGGGRSVWSVGFLRGPDGSDVAGDYIAWGFTDPCPGVQSCPEERGALEYALRLPDGRFPRLGEPKPLIEGGALESGGSIVPLTEFRAIFKSQSAELTRDVDPNPDGEHFPTLALKQGDALTKLPTRNRSNGEEHLGYSLSPDGAWVVSGGRNGALDIYSTTGGTPRALEGHDGDVATVSVSEDGHLVLSGSNDQTVRLWNSQTGELIISLLHLPALDQVSGPGEWIMWTPQGYFAASRGGEKLVGWQVNKGPDKAAEFLTAEQTRTYFLHPEVVARAIQLASARSAVDEFTQSGQISGMSLAELARRSPPRLSIYDPPENFHTTGDRLKITLLRLPQDDPITSYTVFVNGTQVLKVGAGSPQVEPSKEPIVFDVPLFGGRNEVLIRAFNAFLPSEAKLIVFHDGPSQYDKRKNAYILSIGVDKYSHMPEKNLRSAGTDASSFAAAMKTAFRTTHSGKVEAKVYTATSGDALANGQANPSGDEPTKQNIEDALKFLLNADESDTAVLFIAGHGTNAWPSGYTFMPSDANMLDYDTLLPWADIQSTLNKINALKLIFVDTCRSSDVFDQRVPNDALYVGSAFFMAATSQQDAIETAELGGFFTNSIKEGLKDLRADQRPLGDGDRKVQIRELGRFVERNVEDLSEGAQEPYFFQPPSLPKFPLAQ